MCSLHLPCITLNRTSAMELAVIWMLAVEMTVLPRRVTNTSEIMLTLRLSGLVESTLEMRCVVQEKIILINEKLSSNLEKAGGKSWCLTTH